VADAATSSAPLIGAEHEMREGAPGFTAAFDS
jgi:hypothetical protein